MEQNYFFPRDSILPSFWANRIQDFIASLGRFRVEQATANSIRVPAGTEDDAVSLSVERRWRFVEANVLRAHPGGAAGTYSIWVTAADNDIDNAPDPFTDNTDYAFELAITAEGVPPVAVPGSVEIWRLVGELEWDGAAITDVTSYLSFAPSDDPRFPTLDQKAALAGTNGAPADGNRYVTDSDARNSNARTPTAHAASHAPGGADKVDGLVGIGDIALRPDPDDPAAPRVYIVEDANYRIDITDGATWIENVGGGGAMVAVYLESDAAAGVATGQTDPGTTYQDLCHTDGSPVRRTVEEDGLYLIEAQGAGDVNGTGKRPRGRVYRVTGDVTLLERGWGPADADTGLGTDEASLQTWVSDHTDVGAGDPLRAVPLLAGDEIGYQLKANSGVLDLNRDLTFALLRKIAEIPS